jgi:hypothetical protein
MFHALKILSLKEGPLPHSDEAPLPALGPLRDAGLLTA